MGAIAAIVNLDGRPVDEPKLIAMMTPVEHRGPNGNGHWTGDNAGLGVLMHWTTPEAVAEQQPLVSDSGRHVIVWDGRLDNRDDLSRRLDAPASLSGASDAALVLAASQKWGFECPKYLVGDFAFAVWDSAAKRLLCARDPMGTRILHYHFDGRRILIGTEIKQILQVSDVSGSLDELTIGLYLSGTVRYGDRTFYKDIKRLSGGFSLAVSSQGIEFHQFWNPDQWSEIKYRTENEYLDHFREVMSKAVGARLRSATPVAIQLSGGLDSNAVTAFAGAHAKKSGVKVRAFHQVYDRNPEPETVFADLAASSAGLPMTHVRVDDLWAMKEIRRNGVLDEPFVVHFESMIYRTYEVIRSKGCEVVLTGEGGDEAFSPGYFLYLRDWLVRGKLLDLWRDYRGGTPGYRKQARAMLRRVIAPGLRRISRRGPHASVPPWITEDFLAATGLSDDLDRQEAYRSKDSNYMQLGGFSSFVVGNDRRASETGVEMRNPFWDSRVVEFMTRIPPGIRYQGGREKLMLKKALKDLMPAELVNLEPHGAFGPLHKQGFNVSEVERLEGLLTDSRLERMGAIDASTAMLRYRNYRAGDLSQFHGLFWTFVVEEWLRSRMPA